MTVYYSFYSTVVPIGGLIWMMARALWATLSFVVAYALGRYTMRGLRVLWRRR